LTIVAENVPPKQKTSKPKLEVFIVTKGTSALVMHKDSKQKNDRQRNADEPKKRTFSKTHRQSSYCAKITSIAGSGS
jgi:hypothetical protein